ncbi:MAG: SpoIIE family protein phosphatase [Nitrospirae bacterium]|nr:SpoIIE family protein phosphatase [Nitrospirota bacterium]
MQALGISKELSPASVSMKVKSGDIVLLCSDGLTDMLSDEEILSIIRKHSGDIESSADKLVETANAHGGIDNISVVLVSL